MPIVTVSVPCKTNLVGEVSVPDWALDDIQNYLYDNEDVMQEFLSQADYESEYEIELAELQIVD